MSQNGFIVFTATPEMAKQSNRALRSGVTYVAQRATVAKMAESSSSVDNKKTSTKRSTKKKVTKKASTRKSNKKTAKKASTRKTSTKKSTSPKSTRRKSVKPEAIIKFVHENDGCNMTDIERATKLPQATLRRMINSAREAGAITTTGQRRGLRYHIGSVSAEPVMSGADADN